MHKVLWNGLGLSEMADDLVYYDTNIWVAWMRGDSDLLFPKARMLIQDIRSGKSVAIFTTLLLMETIHVLRAKIAANTSYSNLNNYEAIRNQTNTTIQTFIGSLYSMEQNGEIIWVHPNSSLDAHHERVLGKLISGHNRIRTISICPYCKDGRVERYAQNLCRHCNHSQQSIKKYNYKGLGHTDLEHAYIALSHNVKKFYSADRSFEDLENDSDFKSDICFCIVPVDGNMPDCAGT